MAPGGRHTVGETAELVMTLPPLTGLVATIALLRQQPRQGWDSPDMTKHLPAVRALWRVIPGDLVLVRVETGHHAGETRPAETGGNVAAGKDDTLGREPVEVRGLDHLMPHEAEIGPGLVIRDDQEYVRLPGRQFRSGPQDSQTNRRSE